VSRPSDIRIRSAAFHTTSYQYRVPIKFGGRVVTDVVLVDAEVEIETRGGKSAIGHGSMPIGNAWAWPSNRLSSTDTLATLVDLVERVTREADRYREWGHPLEITHALGAGYNAIAEKIAVDRKLVEPIPRLAQLMAASPIEGAIHDSQGQALGRNSYNLLGRDYVAHDLSKYLNGDFAGEYLDQYTLREPKARMPLYHLVGALDPLFETDIPHRINDGLPETLGEWILADGLTHLKIKLAGDNLPWDVDRVARVEMASVEAQNQRGCRTWNYSLDFNEKCASVEYVLDFLAQLKERSPAALARVQYIEQPTHRDLRANPENRMHRAAQIKPVVIDESLVDFESLLLAREQGYSGVALKACKGHGEALLMGAAAQKYGMFLCVQDLTCIGRSMLHSSSLAARIPTIAAIESNGRQYCPAGNAAWHTKFPSMFVVRDGTVGTGALTGPGLGF